MPEFGEERWTIAALLAFVIGPLLFVTSLKFNGQKSATIDPFVDLLTLLVVVGFLPYLWHLGLLIGVVVAQAPSLSIGPRSHRRYLASTSLLLVGMGVIGHLRQVDNWQLSILVLAVVYPAAILYAYVQDLRIREIRRKADSLSALQLLSAGVAHDFNNILMSIEGYAEYAKSAGFDRTSTEKAFGRIVESTQRASSLTRQLVSFSRDETREWGSVDIGKEITALADMLSGSIDRGLNFEIKLPSDPVTMYGDSVHLNQVWLNLMVNAVEASSSPGKITITVTPMDDKIQIEIADEGEGIPPPIRDEIFRPFTSTKEEGHGLGLAVVKNIVDDHKGTIDVISNVGLGTRFILQFPVGEETQRKPDDLTKATILIADDEMPIRVILRQVLEMEGFRVIEAEDGSKFLDLFQKHEQELRAVVLDIKMPGRTGWQCLEVVRRTSPDLPALIVSGFDPEDRINAEPDPAMRFLAKPFRIIEIKSMIHELLSLAAGRKER